MSAGGDPARKSGLSPLIAGGIVAGVLGLSAAIGRRNAPEPAHPGIARWYHRLDKPGYTPPDRVFGAVWPVLETTLAAGGYRLLRSPAGPARGTALALWLASSGMIGGWTQLFFREHRLGLSAVASGAMLATTTGYVAAARRVDRPAAAAGVPLTLWLGFATVLAAGVWRRNR